MTAHARSVQRTGAVLPVVVILLVGLVGFVALALDLGMLAIAKNQAQNAADASALVAARKLNGDTSSAVNYNLSDVPKVAFAIAHDNSILTDPVNCDENSYSSSSDFVHTSGDYDNGDGVMLEIGAYVYNYDDNNPSNEKFLTHFKDEASGNADPPKPYGAVRSTVKYKGNFAFAKIWTSNPFAVQAQAVAVHRPRDVIIIMDMSGSMRFQSLPATPMANATTADPSATDRARTKSMNPETVFPKFGHYSDETTAALRGNTAYPTSTNEYLDPSNITIETNSGKPIVDYFYADTSATANPTTKAFSKAADSFQDTPGGDNYLKENNDSGGNYGKTVEAIRSPAANEKDWDFERDGYITSNMGRTTFNGYTQGPRYWGKTFYIWPPDPRGATGGSAQPSTYNNNGASDWRQRFFVKVPVNAYTAGVSNNPNGSTYAVGYNGEIRVQTLSPNTAPSVGDSVKFGNHNTLYTIASVSNYNSGSAEARIILEKALTSAISDTSSVQVQFRHLSWVDENSLLWDTSTGAIRGPGSNNTVSINGTSYYYRPNYAAILTWLTSSPNPFSAQMRAGRVRYWDSIPDPSSDTDLNNRWWTTDLSTSGQENQRIWREYIDYVLGFRRTSTSDQWTTFWANNSIPISQKIGNGDLFTWGNSFQVSNKPTLATTTAYLSGSIVSNKRYPTDPTLPDTGYVPSYTIPLAAALDSSYIQVSGLSKAPRKGDFVIFGNQTSNTYTIPDDDNAVRTITSGGNTYYGIKLDRALQTVVNTTSGNSVSVSFKQLRYMSYTDNPRRPRHQYWFGPMTMVDFLGNYNTNQFWWPGTVPEAQGWACKAGVQTAIKDIQVNHPNDYLSLVMYNDPKSSATDAGRHNRAKVPLGQNYTKLINSLWFPPSVVNGTVDEITPYSTDMDEVPHAVGGTGPVMGFMIAYNMLSSNSTSLRKYAQTQPKYYGDAGGMGRKGAYKLIVYETDGAPNVNAVASFHSSGGDYYYPIRIKYPDNISDNSNEWPTQPAYALSTLVTAPPTDTGVVNQICKMETDGGFSNERRSVLIHGIAYGSLFDPNNTGTTQTNALNAMQLIQYVGKTATTTAGTDFPAFKQIYGDNTTRINKMKDAFTAIMQDGIQVTLIR